jgi:beta-ureidopropionase / N-carbamoyl-L-amino-acid hydrolase
MSKIRADQGGAATAPPNLDFGHQILDMAEQLAAHSDSPQGLDCTYLGPAHRATAAELRAFMQSAGLAVTIDGVGNVIGRLAAADPGATTLVVGSHYDTVRDAGKYDGRLGILTGIVLAREIARRRLALPFHLDIAAFAEEEGVRFLTAYLGSAAFTGRFDPAWLDRRDQDGARLVEALSASGFDAASIPSLSRRAGLAGYLELHIEQGPVLIAEDLAVGIVSSIAGAVRHAVVVKGEAGHAGTVPMALRRDAAAAAAEIVLLVERRCSGGPGLVGTVGQLAVPSGAVNVVPGRCEFTLDIRAVDDPTRDAAVADVLAGIDRIAARRGVAVDIRETGRWSALAASPRLASALEHAVGRAGIRPFRLVSGAGHDALMFDGVCDMAMLFVRCGNGGVSHSPRETVTAADVNVGARVLLDTILTLADHHADP